MALPSTCCLTSAPHRGSSVTPRPKGAVIMRTAPASRVCGHKPRLPVCAMRANGADGIQVPAIFRDTGLAFVFLAPFQKSPRQEEMAFLDFLAEESPDIKSELRIMTKDRERYASLLAVAAFTFAYVTGLWLLLRVPVIHQYCGQCFGAAPFNAALAKLQLLVKYAAMALAAALFFFYDKHLTCMITVKWELESIRHDAQQS